MMIADDDRGLDEKVECVCRVGHGHLEADIDQGTLDVLDETHVEDVGDDDADGDPGYGVDESLAELGEMLHETHAGEFGAVGDSFAGPVYGVEIIHDELPRWSRLPPPLLRDSWIVWDGVEHRGERGVADWKAGGRWHEIEIAGGGDGQWLGGRFGGLRLLVRVANEELFGDGRGDGVLRAVGDGRRDGSGGLHGGDLLPLLLLVGDAELLFHLHAELVGGAPELGHEFAKLAREFRQLLRPEEKQGEEDEDGAVLKARHKSVP